MLSSSSVRPNQSSQGNAQHTPSGPVTSTLSRYQSLPSSVCVWLTFKGTHIICQRLQLLLSLVAAMAHHSLTRGVSLEEKNSRSSADSHCLLGNEYRQVQELCSMH